MARLFHCIEQAEMFCKKVTEIAKQGGFFPSLPFSTLQLIPALSTSTTVILGVVFFDTHVS